MSSAPNPGAMSPEVERIYRSAAFAQLRRKRRRLALVLTVIMCVIYYGFVLTIAFAPQVLAIKIHSAVTLGMPVGLAVIFSAIVLTGIYVRSANGQFDRLTDEALRSARS